MKAVFVILHYLTADETIDCIDSILCNVNDPVYEIVVVDNHSNNGSVEKLEQRFSSLRHIHFVKLQSNLGFAKGNNAGFQFAKNVPAARFHHHDQ